MNRKKYAVVPFAMSLFIAGCASSGAAKITQYGRMHDVMSGGPEKALSRVSLDEVRSGPGTVALGTAEHLDGEITIYDGVAMVSRSRGDGFETTVLTKASGEGAAWLTVARVDAWREVPIERDMTQSEFEVFLAETAAAHRIDTNAPFAFALTGTVSDLRMHVIKGQCPMRPGAVLTPEQTPWVFDPKAPATATVVGFRAANSVGNLTHPGTTIHAHAILKVSEKDVTGHVERFSVQRGSKLRLPSTK